MPPFHHHHHPLPLDEKTCQGEVVVVVVVERWHGTVFSSRGRWWWWKGWHGTKRFFRFDLFLKNSIEEYFQFDFPGFQGVIGNIFSQIFQNRSYFLKQVDLKIAKLDLNVFPYQWDTLQQYKKRISHFQKHQKKCFSFLGLYAFLSLFPVVTLTSTFLMIAITLRNNIQELTRDLGRK